MSTKWGIISAGKISNDFVRAVSYLPKEEHEIVAVAARDLKAAEIFAKEHKIPYSYGSYEELAANDCIEVVYIGTINPLHYTICKMMLEAGKHVLCEKPLCLKYEDTLALIKLAEEKKNFFMEAVWSRFFPVYDELRKLLAKNSIGDVLYVRASFGVPISNVPRVNKFELGGGTVFDLGVYVIQLAILVLGNNPSVHAIGQLNSEGVDENVECILQYPNGKMASLCTHSKIQMDNSAIIYGTNGCLKINAPFWCPTMLIRPEGEKEFPLPFKSNDMNFVNSEGLAYEAIEVRKCIKEGLIESSRMSHRDTLAISQIQEKICSLINSSYAR